MLAFIVDGMAAFWVTPIFFFGACLVLFVLINWILSAFYSKSHESSMDGFLFLSATLLSLGLGGLVAKHFGLTLNDVQHHPMLAVGAFLLYLVVGTAWSFFKWYTYLVTIRRSFLEAKETFVLQRQALSPGDPWRPLAAQPSSRSEDSKALELWYQDRKVLNDFYTKVRLFLKGFLLLSFDEFIQQPRLISTAVKPQAAHHKIMITSWITFWAINVVWALINDPLRHLVNHLFYSIRRLFQSMSDRLFQNV